MILKIHITLFLALLYNLYIGKKEIFFIAYMFIIMHELAHMIVAILLKVDIEEITLLPFGATAKYSGKMNLCKEFFIALAGPLASLLFAFIYHNDTYFKVNLLILVFNLIPIYPLDGGRMLKVLLTCVLGKKLGVKINNLLNKIAIIFLITFAFYMAFQYKNYSFLLINLYVLKIYKEERQKDRILSIINYLQINK
ncbi:MAG: site-2 protease family protein [Clostridia bacterium]|nr:site-2 protease family protein [Clostridia bacterium]